MCVRFGRDGGAREEPGVAVAQRTQQGRSDDERRDRERERRGEKRGASPARFVHLDRGICVWFVGLDWRRRCGQVSISGMGRARELHPRFLVFLSATDTTAASQTANAPLRYLPFRAGLDITSYMASCVYHAALYCDDSRWIFSKSITQQKQTERCEWEIEILKRTLRQSAKIDLEKKQINWKIMQNLNFERNCKSECFFFSIEIYNCCSNTLFSLFSLFQVPGGLGYYIKTDFELGWKPGSKQR